jgi:hypothetical protein
MRLRKYLEMMGDKKAAYALGFKERTVMSWRLGHRIPRPAQAKVIVEKTPVTWQGIYEPY